MGVGGVVRVRTKLRWVLKRRRLLKGWFGSRAAVAGAGAKAALAFMLILIEAGVGVVEHSLSFSVERYMGPSCVPDLGL